MLPVIRSERREQGEYRASDGLSVEEYVRQAHVTGATELGYTLEVVGDHDQYGNILVENTYTPGADLALHVQREFLNVEVATLKPGMEVGAPCGLTIGYIREDAVHPSPGRVWVKERVKEALASADLRGLQFIEVKLERGTEHPVPRLWEIVALGRGRTKRYLEEPPSNCPICGRNLRETPPLMDLDPASWDGSDFIIVDANPNRLVVTHRVREVLEGIKASNVHFEEVGNTE